MGFIDLNLNPMSVPSIADRERILNGYAERWINDGHVHESRKEFVEQAALDLQDKTVVFELMAKIRRLERERRIAA